MCTDTSIQGQQIDLTLTLDDVSTCMRQNPAEQIAFLASAAKRQRAEVKERNLSAADFKALCRSKREGDQVMAVHRNCAENSPEPNSRGSDSTIPMGTHLETGGTHHCGSKSTFQAKGHVLVILGYEDPQLESLARDSPTMGKDSRTLIFQYAASTKQKIRSFDIQTAFLRGSRSDGRILGMDPPPEMRSMMRLQPWECCELLKSAYGLVNAPLLWYEETP